MKLIAITLGCCALSLMTSLALFKGLTPIEVSTTESTALPASPALTPIVEAEPLTRATQALPKENILRAFAIPLTFTVGETNTYIDGLIVTFESISDSPCPQEIACTKMGTLISEFTIASTTFFNSEKIALDSAHTTTNTTDTYQYTLVNTTKTQATIIITPRSTTTEEAINIEPKTISSTAPIAQQTVAVTKTLPQSPVIKNKPAVPKSPDTTLAEFKKALVLEIEKQTNEFRRNHKRAPLATDSDLAKNATSYSAHLLSNTYLSHTDIAGCDITCRFTDKGYAAQAWGENLAMLSINEQPSVEYVANFFMRQWEKSAGHRANLLSKAFTNQGVGVAFDQNKIYMVVQFANPQ